MSSVIPTNAKHDSVSIELETERQTEGRGGGDKRGRTGDKRGHTGGRLGKTRLGINRLVGDSRTAEQVFGTFEIKTPAPSPDPALEELFSDVDASYYDLDTVLTGMQSAPKMGPYDLLESLSSHGPSALSSSSSCRADLNELDHIMEIIVGS